MEAQNQSEIAQILKQIEQEYQAARLGMNGFSQGTCQHAFINVKQERLIALDVALIQLVGHEVAMQLTARIGNE